MGNLHVRNLSVENLSVENLGEENQGQLQDYDVVDTIEGTRINRSISEEAEALAALCKNVAPVWAGQISAARTITDEAIIALSQRFYGLSQQIQQTVGTSAADIEHESTNLIGLLNESQSELNSIITLIRSSFEEKRALFQAVLDLSSFTKELQNMADNVKSIAHQTSIVAINAAIEAAHVGQAGRGFTVVANEVRRLSNLAADTGKQIGEKVRVVSDAIHHTKKISLEFEAKDAQMLENSQLVVQKTVSKLNNSATHLIENEESMRATGQHVNSEISEVLVSLQFQDRVTQMLSHVQQDLNKLEETVRLGNQIIDAGTWLDALANTYTMQEQHDIQAKITGKGKKSHPSSKTNAGTSHAGDSNNEITFF